MTARRAFVVALAGTLAAGCALGPTDAAGGESAEGKEIAPYGIHEVCLKLAAGERIDWRYESRAPVHFNIHYHDGPSVVMPITRDGSTGDSGIFAAAIAQEYCAMWEAGAQGAVIDYRVRPAGVAR